MWISKASSWQNGRNTQGRNGFPKTKISTFFEEPSASQNVDIVDKQLTQQFIPDFYNISRPHSYQQVSGAAIFRNKFFYFLKGLKIFTVPAQGLHLPLKVRGADPQIVRLSRGIYFSQDHPVGKRQRSGEIRKKGSGSGIGMRLKNTPEGAVGIICRRF